MNIFILQLGLDLKTLWVLMKQDFMPLDSVNFYFSSSKIVFMLKLQH